MSRRGALGNTDEHYTLLARDGNKGAVYWVLMRFCSQVIKRKPVSCEILAFITDAFIEILSGTDANKALRLRQRRRGPQVKNRVRDESISLSVYKRMQGGMNLFDAALDVSEIFGLHESKIQDIYRKNKKYAKASLPFWQDVEKVGLSTPIK